MKLDFPIGPEGVEVPPDLLSLTTAFIDIWKESSASFQAKNLVRIERNLQPVRGMQSIINKEIQAVLRDSSWQGERGTYIKNDVWLRITFRHSIGIGDLFLNALRANKRESFKSLAIVCPDQKLLHEVSERDANTLTSFEKTLRYWEDVRELIPMPLWIGRLRY